MGFFKTEDSAYFGIGIEHFKVVRLLLILTLIALFFFARELFNVVLFAVFLFSPLWVPVLLGIFFWRRWVAYVRSQYIAQQEKVLLEIRIPQRITKTPRAMELVLAGMNVGPGETTFIDRWWTGKVRPWWSLEIVSIEGKIHFYVWTFEKQREFVESQFYSQFPDIEIYEVEDYMQGLDGASKDLQVWGMEYVLSKPDAYPIKTYIDYQLDEPSKDAEQIVDPITTVFEKLSTLGPGEVMALQIVVRQNKGSKNQSIFAFSKPTSWKDEAKAEIEKIYEEGKPKNTDVITGEVSEGYPLLKPQQVNTIKALERSIEKPGYDAGMRAIYVAKKDSFKGHRISPYLVNIYNTFASGYLNKFRPSDQWHVTLDYPWQDIGGRTSARYSVGVIDAFRRRLFFHEPYNNDIMVLTTEELATIFHFPTEELKAPGVERITSKRGEPPANLPI